MMSEVETIRIVCHLHSSPSTNVTDHVEKLRCLLRPLTLVTLQLFTSAGD